MEKSCIETSAAFNIKVEQLKAELVEKKMQLKKAEQELESLEYIKKLEQDANKKVIDLEQTIEEARAKHSQEIQGVELERDQIRRSIPRKLQILSSFIK